MRQGIVVQARMSSTRLPGKVLRTAGGRTLLELCALRAARARNADVVVIATTERDEDEAIAAEARKLGLPCTRGSETDVLSRYHLAALDQRLEVVCRITSDCPFIDPEIVDAAFELYLSGSFEYTSNTLVRTFPRGLDVEVFGFEALQRAHREALLPEDREHVTPYFYRHPELFRLGNLTGERDLSHHRWTVDEEDDFRFLAAVIDKLHGDPISAGYRDVLALVDADPALAVINASVEQKEV